MSGRAARKARAIILRVWFGLNIPFGTRRLSRRVHRARRKAGQLA